ncbi:hypothetical protein SAMN04488689_103750 [Paenibacillus sp. cl6col]|nr:hypothetical protein SAMN04488689_103750 [Paenibacillus sp. cl6col]
MLQLHATFSVLKSHLIELELLKNKKIAPENQGRFIYRGTTLVIAYITPHFIKPAYHASKGKKSVCDRLDVDNGYVPVKFHSHSEISVQLFFKVKILAASRHMPIRNLLSVPRASAYSFSSSFCSIYLSNNLV